MQNIQQLIIELVIYYKSFSTGDSKTDGVYFDMNNLDKFPEGNISYAKFYSVPSSILIYQG